MLEAGTSLPERRIDFVSPDTMQAWAPILADPNPIHLDREAVRASGLGDRRINQGPINVAYVMDMLQAALPGGIIERFSNRFVDNVYEGEALLANATVTSVEQRNGIVRIGCDFVLTSLERGPVITGKSVVAIPEGTMISLGWTIAGSPDAQP